MSLPKHVHIRRSGTRVFAIVGDAGDGSTSMDAYRYRTPHTHVTDVHTGTRFVVPTARVEKWPLVDAPQATPSPARGFSIGDRVRSTLMPQSTGHIVDVAYGVLWDDDVDGEPDEYAYGPDELAHELQGAGSDVRSLPAQPTDTDWSSAA